METPTNNILEIAAVQQITNNTTCWIGRRSRNNDNIVTGQTFVAFVEGDLEAIEVFSSIVTKPGKVTMTLYSFNKYRKSWGDELGSVSIDFDYSETGKWISFNFTGLRLDKGKSYGFRLASTDTYIGLGEATGSYKIPPFIYGEKWIFSKKDQAGQCSSYFSMAFKVGLRA